MDFKDIKKKCRQGYKAMIPGWEGYLDWDYSKDEIYFHNKDYILSQTDLENNFNIQSRTDLYYII